MSIETRSAKVLEVRANADGTHEADIRLMTYGVVDAYKTRFMPGVFARQIAEGMVSSCWAHDSTRPIGVVTDFRDSPETLDGTLKFLPFEDCPDARLAWSSMKNKAIRETSVGFERMADERNVNMSEVRDITDANLIEASPVLSGAVPGAKVLAVRTAPTAEAMTAALPETDATELIRWFASVSDEERSKFLALIPAEEVREENPQTHEFRALVTDPSVDPMQVLKDIDAEVAKLTGALDAEDLDEARQFFGAAADKLRQLQYALGLTPSYGCYAAPDPEVRADESVETTAAFEDETPDELDADQVGPVADEDVFADLDALSRGKTPKKPYGDVAYADPGYQADKKKRYPLTADKVQAAWAYINQSKNQKPYTSAQLSSIKSKIKSAMAKFGHNVSDNGGTS